MKEGEMVTVPRDALIELLGELNPTYNRYSKTPRSIRNILDSPQPDRSGLVEALNDLELALMFARCNMDHAGTRRDVGKAIAQLNRLRELLVEEWIK